MKKMQIALFALVVGLTWTTLASLSLVSPREGEVVGQLHPAQLTFVSQTKEQRDKYFTEKKFVQGMRADGSAPKPIVLSWTGDAKSYVVRVRRLPDGKEFYSLTVPSNSVAVDSLEIARTWEWTVTAGAESAQGTFKTEDRAPRLIRIAGVNNARDIGGRIGLGGRRIRQGLFYRTSGLNSNAPQDYYTVAEVKAFYAAGDLKKFGSSAKNVLAKLKAGTEIVDRDIKRARLVKRECFKPGAKRLTEAERARIVNFYGFKSDIDLRSDHECYGMTGSPLGPDVKWWHIPYSSYTGAFETDVKKKVAASYRVLTDARNYPIVVHCIGGADRTGTFCMLFEALLGVDEDELWKDYLTTGFVGIVSDARHQQKFTRTMDALRKMPGATLADKAESYFLSCGLTKDDIAFLRDFLLEK